VFFLQGGNGQSWTPVPKVTFAEQTFQDTEGVISRNASRFIFLSLDLGFAQSEEFCLWQNVKSFNTP